MRLDSVSVEELVLGLIGEEVIPLVKLLISKQNYSEFKLAEQLNVNVNYVRNLLYKLGSYNLVSSIRKKDKKKGWYIYYWSLDNREINSLIIEMKRRSLAELRDELKSEENDSFFVCVNSCIRVSLENAMEHEFKCQECGGLLVQDDSVKKIEEIKRKISKIEEELKEYEEKKVKVLARKIRKAVKKVPKKKVVKGKVGVKRKKAAKKKTKKKIGGKRAKRKVKKILKKGVKRRR